ncbi:MAG: hypothetical protein IT375_16460 [Polyangiaceae bacterium]|nr:hypothetical protein [Polyangiaceae bacterium]
MTETHPGDAWQRLFHRWFIQYNPLYLFSAALVLGGVTLMSRGLALSESPLTQLLVGGVAELYSWALLAGVLLLRRAGLRRPAVLLGLIAVLYQGDLTLHSETVVYHGPAGVIGSALWLASFVGKVLVLARGFELVVPPRVLALVLAGGGGIALLPHYLGIAMAGGGDWPVALWLFALTASALFAPMRVTSLAALGAWGETVLRRALRATWAIWAVLVLFHVWFWGREFGVTGWSLVPALLLVVIRRVPAEAFVFAAAGAVLGITARFRPEAVSMVACFVAAALALRAFRSPRLVQCAQIRSRPPYREPPMDPVSIPELVFVRAERAAWLRLLTGSLFALYVAVWAHGATPSAWPAHSLALDIVLVAAVTVWVWRARALFALVPLGAVLFHAGVERGLISAPRGSLEWGLTQIALGFLLLLGSVGITLRWQRRAVGRPEP